MTNDDPAALVAAIRAKLQQGFGGVTFDLLARAADEIERLENECCSCHRMDKARADRAEAEWELMDKAHTLARERADRAEHQWAACRDDIGTLQAELDRAEAELEDTVELACRVVRDANVAEARIAAALHHAREHFSDHDLAAMERILRGENG